MIDVAVVQLASWGDVIISTLITAAIRAQKPDWQLTYYVSESCAGAITNNQHINKIIVIPGNKDRAWAIQDKIIAEARRKHDKVITPWAGWYPQTEWLPVVATNWPGMPHHNFMWCYVRAAQSEGLHIELPPTIYLYLTEAEKTRAAIFLSQLQPAKVKVLMEVEGHSSQSWLNQSWLSAIQTVLESLYGDDVILLVSKGGQETQEIAQAKTRWPGRVHLLNNYSLREVAAIFNGCDVFIGCSSGTSNACHAHFCRTDVKWFEAVNSTVWDSRPLRPTGKHIYYGANVNEFADMIAKGLS